MSYAHRFRNVALVAGMLAAGCAGPVSLRYPSGEFPSRVRYSDDVKLLALGRPATAEDVRAGRALFTFDGLGESRVWPLPDYPTSAVWHGCRRHPVRMNDGSLRYGHFGNVIQAEELRVNGVWRRYFGFLGKEGAAVVPAAEVNLSLPWYREDPFEWLPCEGGLELGITRPGERKGQGKPEFTPCPLDRPIPVRIALRNRRGAAIETPGDLCRDLGGGTPFFRRGVRPRLRYAPYAPHDPSQRESGPDDDAYTDVPGRWRTHEADAERRRGQALDTGESVEVGAMDLREGFRIDRPGHYEFGFDVDAAELGLPDEERWGPLSVRVGFCVGEKPRPLTIEELNAEIGELGGAGVEERLRKSIADALRTPPPDRPGAPPLPADFPAFGRVGFMGGNMSGHESEFVQLTIANLDLLGRIDGFAASGVRAEFERRMESERELPALRLLDAAVAAAAGSEKAALEILEAMKSTDYVVTENVHSALADLLRTGGDAPPDWAVDLALAALADERYVTGLEKTNFARETVLRISYLADEDGNLAWLLGLRKCRRAVPFLIERLRKTSARGYVMALGKIGDPRAIPVLLELVERHDWAEESEGLSVEGIVRVNDALADLKAVEAVPALLERIEFPEVIAALERIGDPRALPALRRVAADGGRVFRHGKAVLPSKNRERLKASRIALASLEPGDAVPRLLAFLDDRTLDEYDRVEIVRRLGDRPDSRSVPVLVRVVRSDSDGALVVNAIAELQNFPYPSAVDGLIECFEADFADRTPLKGPLTRREAHDRIGYSLAALTGRSFGADPERWKAWWNTNRGKVELKPPSH